MVVVTDPWTRGMRQMEERITTKYAQVGFSCVRTRACAQQFRRTEPRVEANEIFIFPTKDCRYRHSPGEPLARCRLAINTWGPGQSQQLRARARSAATSQAAHEIFARAVFRSQFVAACTARRRQERQPSAYRGGSTKNRAQDPSSYQICHKYCL